MASRGLFLALIVSFSARSGKLEATNSVTSQETQNESSIDALRMMREGKVLAKNAAIILSSPAGVGFINRRLRCRFRNGLF